MKLSTLIVLSFALLGIAAFAADFAGTWKGEAHSNEGGVFPISVTLKVDGANLTGTVTQGKGDPKEIENGKADPDQISFILTFKAPAGTRTVSYTGKFEGDQLKLSSQREGSKRVQDMMLTRN